MEANLAGDDVQPHCEQCSEVESFTERYSAGQIDQPIPDVVLELIRDRPQVHYKALDAMWLAMRAVLSDTRSLHDYITLLIYGARTERVSFLLLVHCLLAVRQGFERGNWEQATVAFRVVIQTVALSRETWDEAAVEAFRPWFTANYNDLLNSPAVTDLHGLARDCSGLPGQLAAQFALQSIEWIAESAPVDDLHSSLHVYLATMNSLNTTDRFEQVFGVILPRFIEHASSDDRHFLVELALGSLPDSGVSGELLSGAVGMLRNAVAPFEARTRLAYVERLLPFAIAASPRAYAELLLVRFASKSALSDLEGAARDLEAIEKLDQQTLPRDIRASTIRSRAHLLFRRGSLDSAVSTLQEALQVAESVRLIEALKAEITSIRILNGTQEGEKLDSFSEDLPVPAWLGLVHTQALGEFAAGRYRESQEILESGIARYPSPGNDNATYTRRRIRALMAANCLMLGAPQSALTHLLTSISDLTDAVIESVAGTERKARARRLAEVEMLLDLALQLISLNPAAHAPQQFEDLWMQVAAFRDIELEFHTAVNIATYQGNESATNYLVAASSLGQLLQSGFPTSVPPEQQSAALTMARRELYDAEVAVSHLPLFSERLARRLSRDFGDVRAVLDASTVLVDFVRYWSGGFDADGQAISGLMAFMARGSDPSMVGILFDRRAAGTAESLALLLGDLDLHIPEHFDLDVVNDELISAIASVLGDDDTIQRVVVIPDGNVRQLNLASLMVHNGYLDERVTFVHIGSLHDLFEDQRPVRAQGAPAVIAVSDFGEVHGSNVAGFPPLPAARIEGEWVGNIFAALSPNAQVENDPDILDQGRPRYVHIATHGFFSEGPELSTLVPEEDEQPGLLASPQIRNRNEDSRLLDASLRSGLALAHANAWISGDSGPTGAILTAMDFLTMDLAGTAVAVLSGCKTAQGTSRRYEGAADLRRSLRAAGVRVVILAIRDVPDTATAILMRLFWSRVAAGQSPAESLRGAQSELRGMTVANMMDLLEVSPAIESRYLRELSFADPASTPFSDPYFWAAFVCYESR